MNSPRHGSFSLHPFPLLLDIMCILMTKKHGVNHVYSQRKRNYLPHPDRPDSFS